MELHGLGDNLVEIAKTKVTIEIQPWFPSSFSFEVEALVLPALASVHLHSSFFYNKHVWKNFELADPNYYKNERIDMVLGGDVYVEILKNCIHKKNGMLGQNTKLGLMLSGPLTVRAPVAKKGVNVTTEIERFWETEELEIDMVANDDNKCLEMYAATTKRNAAGRFIVQIPFKEDKTLGGSYKQAAARLISLEKRLSKDSAMKNEYARIMEEYITLGHMKQVKQIHSGKYYLPHQAVIREDSLTTKVRVVFDASAVTTNGRSLNDVMYVGPRLQRDVFDILVNFRLKKYVISSDVDKMYRQILVDEGSQQYQLVLWRKDMKNEIKEYQLTTVTFGTASAPFLAVRTLMEIAKECSNMQVQKIIEEDFYMDDILTGADPIEECLQLRQIISQHLDRYLRKWCSNNELIIKSSNEDKENEICN
uniref:Reverse transcriptase domain-containing protein n=1 Tax=Stomoxys calcitrans TaxID=35570 RepID=A0A1I8PW33_STOCA